MKSEFCLEKMFVFEQIAVFAQNIHTLTDILYERVADRLLAREPTLWQKIIGSNAPQFSSKDRAVAYLKELANIPNSLMSFEKNDIEYQFMETLSELQRFIARADAVFKIAELSPEPTINIHFDDFDFILSLNKNKTKILEFLND